MKDIHCIPENQTLPKRYDDAIECSFCESVLSWEFYRRGKHKWIAAHRYYFWEIPKAIVCKMDDKLEVKVACHKAECQTKLRQWARA